MKRLKDYYTYFSLKCFIVRIVLFPGIHTFPPIFCALIIFLCLILKKKKAHSSVGVACDFKTECPRRQLISFFFFFHVAKVFNFPVVFHSWVPLAYVSLPPET